MGCNALLEPQYIDFIMQVRIDHRDNDGIGFDFGWKSIDDHFRIHKVNDRWPSPAADTVGGPALKIKRRNGLSCEPQPMDHANICYDTVAFIDQYWCIPSRNAAVFSTAGRILERLPSVRRA
mmetsp:Transcript_3104/g.9656  ORF Transcript_3104/g.9656 Transcript_3104/m.9656 type:complete len:122 (+) Transcript_3104:513-878(+)